jgi:phage tail sheath protein FI
MPVQPTYPGVYVQEVSSGVKTITGVSTSVCAFVGTAKRGPINKAVNILSYSDFERRFGGLDANSEMSYSVRQFFMNGGTNAWIVRLAKNPISASTILKNNDAFGVLTITALEEGKAGNNIEVQIDYNTSNPACKFNLTFIYTSPDNPMDSNAEKYLDLSMNSKDARYVENMINGASRLVMVKRVTGLTGTATPGIGSVYGTSQSGNITATDLTTLIDDTHNQLNISVNGSDYVNIKFDPLDPVSGTTYKLSDQYVTICDAIKAAVQAADTSNPAFNSFDCVPNSTPSFTVVPDSILMTSGNAGEESTVRVLPGLINDAAARLKLGTLYGGIEADAVASICPAENHGTLTSGSFTSTTPPSYSVAVGQKILISLDGLGPDPIDFTSIFPTTLDEFAAKIQTLVKNLKPGNPAYNKFTCKVISPISTTYALVLTSGSQGAGSSIKVFADGSKTLASDLKLSTGIQFLPNNIYLANGAESPFTASDAYNIYIGNRSLRKGIYALEEVDLFNLLCLPGISDSGILMDVDAYCKERRAFMIADPPQNLSAPSDMITSISGTTFPKTEYGAVYYPWIRIADPLNGGKPRSSAPCGTIAGLYARTDSNRGVWKAPAGTEATLTGVQGVDYLLTDPENGTLNPLGVNCIRIFPAFGAIAWGARTLRGNDQMTSEYKYIPVRRLALYLEESLYRGLKWVVFEPNDEPLWSQIRLNVGSFMNNLFRQGAFQGMTPRDAYFVKCDKETTTQNDINLGIVNIWVGFAPLKPAEFVILHIQQMAGQINQ